MHQRGMEDMAQVVFLQEFLVDIANLDQLKKDPVVKVLGQEWVPTDVPPLQLAVAMAAQAIWRLIR